jgi:hypothetical protein
MSHSHDDRVAERPHHLCAAYGCPLLGSMATSTSGASEWWCFAHFGKDAGQLQRITSEVRQLEWLSQAITDIRSRHENRADWPAKYQRIDHDLMLQQRGDLRFSGSMNSRMDTELWLVKLEVTLDGMIRALVPATPLQASISAKGKSVGGFQRIGFEVPA